MYADPTVYDPVLGYGFPSESAALTRHTGYLAEGRGRGLLPHAGARDARKVSPAGRYVLATVGGGQDGTRLAGAFAGARFPAGHQGVLVTGPLPARRSLRGAGSDRPALAAAP